jgi:hypothetical protein
MKKVLLVCLSILVMGCSAINQKYIVGVWQTELIQSEWGPQITTLYISSDKTVVQDIFFTDENGSLKLEGTYKVREKSLEFTWADKPNGSFTIQSDILKLTDNNLVLKYENEIYDFKKK